jgi:predicted aldo/keto reductase-like oxidoreductase
MQYRNYGKLGYQVSALGLGCMRLPRIYREGSNTAEVDREKAYEIIRYAADHGINYFDTAYGYHNRTSEEVLGEALEGGRREKVKIVTKQPFPVMTDLKSGGGKTIHENARRNLENTLKKLRTSYLDVYLIHNIQTSTWEDTKKNKIIEEYEKFRAEGLIRAIGFSYHGKLPGFKEVLEFYDWGMCQIQQNLLDVNNEATAEGVRLAGKKGCALVVMEPLRGGGLASPPPAVKALFNEHPVKRSAVEWAFRHILNYPEVSTVLSGLTTMEQLKEDIEIFSKPDAVPNCLSGEEKEIINRVRAKYESMVSIPCTACEYCLPCPKGVNIPGVFSKFNEGAMFGSYSQPQRSYLFQTRSGQDASLCAACGACEKKCPQHIGIIKELKTAHEALKGWVE